MANTEYAKLGYPDLCDKLNNYPLAELQDNITR